MYAHIKSFSTKYSLLKGFRYDTKHHCLFSAEDILNPASYLWVCCSALGLPSSYLQQCLGLLLRLDNTK